MAASTALQVVVSPFLGVVFDNLSSLIQKEIGLVLGVNKELEKLSNILSTIQDVLEDAEAKQIEDKPIKSWLRKLKDLVYDADDILDECATEALIPESDDIVRNNSCNTQVTSPSSSTCFNLKGIMFRRSIGKRIKKLSEKFDAVAKLRSDFHLNLTPKLVESGRKEQRETSSTLSEPQIYGREKEKEHIANLLLKGGDDVVSVCCIVGMGGLGKTTLAQSVYNDENVTNHFQLKCWVCVSDDFVHKTLLKSIIESATKEACMLNALDPLESRVKEILSGKKFLLVLDDVWNEDQTKWNNLKSLLTRGGIGSSIIVTTRLESVASLTSSTLQILHLKYLSEEDCWSLFKNYAFDVENKEYHQKFEEIGKEIVKKCGGVPLAAKALGGSLRFKKTENDWLSVRDSALWDLPQDKKDAILPALRLSYNYLSPHLKQCFSYCSIFPKDCRMKKEELIHLWMANGFIQSKESMGLEDIGNENFNELLERSFFQETMKDEYGDIMNCKMHDLVHDLACSITMNECTTVEVHKDNNVFKPSTRHLLLEFGISFLLPDILSDILNLWLSKSQPLLRTFFQRGVWRWDEHFIHGLTFTNLKCLRVLDLSHTDITTLHVSIGNLKHLRYLDLSYCFHIRSLPDECICNLRNLQVLKLDNCTSLQVLPGNTRKMINLRHLGIKGCDALKRMPVGMGNLSCLRTLSLFIVAPKTGHGITELHGLDHLTGELKIKGLEHVRNSKDATNANLMRKKHLRVLSLVWSEKSNETIEEEEEEVALIGEGLKPHPDIKKLHLECYNGLKFPSWMSDSSCVPNLVKISLVGCRRCEHLPPLGSLPLLEVLKISGMDSVKEFIYDDHSPQGSSSLFPSLRKLYICEMPNLEEWYPSPSQQQVEEENIRVLLFPSLEKLILETCSKLRTLPTPLSSALKILKVISCDEILESLPPISSASSSFSSSSISSSLVNVEIGECKELVCLPEEIMQNLTSLKSFYIWECPSLKYLPELGRSRNNNNTALRSLNIYHCSGLTSVSDCLRHLTTLEDLWIGGCPELEFLPDDFQDLTSLRYLWIGSLPKMTCLPEGLQQVAGTLESLTIFGCSGLTSLPEWMDEFTSLRQLDIEACENLKVLPEEVLHLTSLKDVKIRDCHPDMHRRYAKETGEDWHKIAHRIPFLSIDVTPGSKSRHGIGGGGGGRVT